MSDKGDKAEQIMWWDVLDVLEQQEERHVDKALQMARECRHPDAQWLASLFPAGVAVTRRRMMQVMKEQGEDPRALHVTWLLGDDDVEANELLERASAKGYAPAQAELSSALGGCPRSFELAQLSAAQGSRRGMGQLGWCLRYGAGCAKDANRAMELFRAAAELGDRDAQVSFVHLAFGPRDWRKFHWWSLAVARGAWQASFVNDSLSLIAGFEVGELGRILHIVAPVLRANRNVAEQEVFGKHHSEGTWRMLLRVLELHQAMLDRARCAIACWSMAGCRRGLVKDMRVMVAKMLWKEPWQWSKESDGETHEKKAKW
jgi:TPR repeat protein